MGYGTLAECTSDASPCQWMGKDNRLVNSDTILAEMIAASGLAGDEALRARRNLLEHMMYMEDVQRYAARVGHSFPYLMGVNERHLTERRTNAMLPQAFVHQEMKSGIPRALFSSRRLDESGGSEFNWCSASNSKKMNVCTAVKSQAKCGSCWAFAATDAIETAVAINSDDPSPTALSAQQLLQCSQRDMDATFQYCWVGSVSTGASWMSSEIKWKSKNDGCNGGMTHGAFRDIAQLQIKLASDLSIPYTESEGLLRTQSECPQPDEAVASITGWDQVVGKDCSQSSDPNVLLRQAVEVQPIAVAINSDGPFKDYKGGFYACPNDGILRSKDEVNHALVLVGYGTDATRGDYWILKNSYGGQWGDQGYMKLLADDKLNCGLNVFPVIPTGAQRGSANVTVDSGGEKVFVGLSPSTWIVVASFVGALTIALTIGGLLVQRHRRKVIRLQNSSIPLSERVASLE